MIRVSREFRAAVKLAEMPAWRIAYEAGINPNVLSKIMSGALRVREGDKRILKVAKVLGIDPNKCFVNTEGNNENSLSSNPRRGTL